MSKNVDPRGFYLEIATQQFADHGFHGVSLAKLAKEAGVSKQALLHFFGTKERLYGDVLSALNERLCMEIDAGRGDTPTARLKHYLHGMVQGVAADQRDVRLVVRALLDSDPKAQFWPLKPYLDRLVALVQGMPKGAQMSRERALAEAYRFIGSVQYVAISLPTLRGIYGEKAQTELISAHPDFVEETIARLT